MAVLRTFLLFFVSIITVFSVFAKEPEVNCPAPRSPDHGQTFLYQDGSVVKYVCDPGFTLIGREMVRCVDGKWEEPLPFCLEVSGAGSEVPPKVSSESSNAPPVTRPLFDWNGEENATLEEGELAQSDEARLRMVIMPRRRARLVTARVARLHRTSELEEEEKRLVGKKEDAKSTTTIHLDAPPSLVYVRRTITPGKSDSQEQTLREQYRTASVHVAVDKDGDEKLQVVTLPRAAVSRNDKGDESLRHLYWMAQQYYPRSSSLVEYRRGSPAVVTLSESQMAWINSLHPELRDQYLRDLYVLRSEEAVEGARALSFLRRYDDGYNYYVRQPLIAQDLTPIFDYSCNQAGSHFVTAPKLPNAHIARYDRRQNPNPPHQHYLTAVYRCNPGYVMLDTRFTELTCSRRNWIGTEPICVPRT